MLKKIENIIKKVSWIPFVLGFIGYFFMDGGADGTVLNVFEAIYASAALYFVNPVVDNRNAVITIAQIFALLITTSFILSILQRFLEPFVHMLIGLGKNSTAVFTNTVYGEKLVKKLKRGFLAKELPTGRIEKATDQIILFDEDTENFEFYMKHKKELDDNKGVTYMGLHHVDSSLLSSFEDSVRYFCIDEIIARDFWKKFNLYDEINTAKAEGRKVFKIAIIGYGTMGKAIFKQAYLNNIYMLDQKIEYHIWGADTPDRTFLEGLNFANSDTIRAYPGSYREDIGLMKGMDRIIVAAENPLQTIQNLLLQDCNCMIYFWNENGADYTSFFKSNNLRVFGEVSDILTEENIKTERLYQQAKLVNYAYELLYSDKPKDAIAPDYEEQAEQLWNGLDGFLKGSNIARADHWWIEKRNADNGVPKEERKEMEHIRWCRYHYYHGWTYAEKKDKAAHKHPCLVPYAQLSQFERDKDDIDSLFIREKIDELI